MQKRKLLLITLFTFSIFISKAQTIDSSRLFNGSWAKSFNGEKYGYTTLSGKVLIDYKYDKIEYFGSRGIYTYAFIGKKQFLIDTLGNEYLFARRTDQLNENTRAYNGKIEPEVFKYTKLEHLVLDDRHREKIPSEIGNLKNVFYLKIKARKLEKLPKEITEKLTRHH